MISSDSLIRFKRLYRQEYGVEISDKKAYELATNLVNLYRAVYLGQNSENINHKYEKELQATQAES